MAIYPTYAIGAAFKTPLEMLDKVGDIVYFWKSFLAISVDSNCIEKMITPLGGTIINFNPNRSIIKQ
jgi:hypothetical protein